ncbi:ABC transporter substrate-binding protein [Bacillus sp. M6-12]|uniref:EcsC family protein n=1 Tax=Bacillus sp. M6-12 TaxID=2054166 RepID=UPI000C7941E6|nr:EcsC family protein [Bacillus sp. M6-12]PLS14842.1 ABC transporter substrate-binding protein [Bacillus sp. M6-12]
MALTERETLIWNEISGWEEKLFQYEPTDLEILYEKWLEQTFLLLPEEIRAQFFAKLDSWLFHLHAMVQSSQIQLDARERLLSSARVFSPEVISIDDMRELSIDQLKYIADQQIARHRLYSFAQGGISGTGGVVLLGSDIPAMTVINLRAVQLVAMTYGVEVNTPFEMTMALKVFRAGAMPRRLQGYGWEELIQETNKADDYYFYEGKEELTDASWLEQPLKQILKAAAITILRKKLFQGVPLLSVAIGAGSNYRMTRGITEFAHKYYQYRYLLKKRGDN